MGDTGANIDAATKVGTAIAEKCKALNISTVVFDKGGFLYHGRVKAVAEGAREADLCSDQDKASQGKHARTVLLKPEEMWLSFLKRKARAHRSRSRTKHDALLCM